MTDSLRLTLADARSPDHILTLLTYARKLSAESTQGVLAPRPRSAKDVDETLRKESFEVFLIGVPTKPNAIRTMLHVALAASRNELSRRKARLRNSEMVLGMHARGFYVGDERQFGDETAVRYVSPLWRVSDLTAAFQWALSATIRYGSANAAFLRNSSFRGIYLGDLVASSLLRLPFRVRRRGKAVLFFFELWRSASICAWALRAQDVVGGFTSTPEPTYPHAIIARVCEANGATFVEPGARGELRVSTSNLINGFRPVMRVQRVSTLHASTVQAAAIGKQRIAGELAHPYLKRSVSRADEWPKSFLQSVPEAQPGIRRAVVFLHSFSDGELICGLNGFSSLLEWAIATAENLGGGSWEEVIVRPHPHATFESSEDSLAALQMATRALTNVIFASPAASLENLLSGDATLVVTHHGTIALEAAALGKNCVYSDLSPWAPHWNIGYSWADPVDYARLLASPTLQRPPSADLVAQRIRDVDSYLGQRQVRPGYVRLGLFHHQRTREHYRDRLESLSQDRIYEAMVDIWNSVTEEEALSLIPPHDQVDFVPSRRWIGI